MGRCISLIMDLADPTSQGLSETEGTHFPDQVDEQSESDWNLSPSGIIDTGSRPGGDPVFELRGCRRLTLRGQNCTNRIVYCPTTCVFAQDGSAALRGMRGDLYLAAGSWATWHRNCEASPAPMRRLRART